MSISPPDNLIDYYEYYKWLTKLTSLKILKNLSVVDNDLHSAPLDLSAALYASNTEDINDSLTLFTMALFSTGFNIVLLPTTCNSK